MSVVRLLLVSAALSAWIFFSTPMPAAEKGKYSNIEIQRFDVASGVEFPADWLATMMDEVVRHITETKRFKEVLRQGEKPNQAAPTLKLTGTVVQYKAGNRAVRYMVGFGAGKTKIVANVKFVDAATRNALLEKKVDGKVWIGFAGGDSVGATRGLAKELAQLARKSF